MQEVIKKDVLIIGAAAAGIFAAIRAQEEGTDVLVINSGALGRDSAATWMAGDGLNTALYPPDSYEVHARDTIVYGRYLNNQELTYTMLRELRKCLSDLDSWGLGLLRRNDRIDQRQMPGHSYARSFSHEKGELFGFVYRKVMPKQLRDRKIKVIEDCLITDLLTEDGRVVGAVGIDLGTGEFKVFSGKCVILATGGYPSCYKYYCSSPGATGTGHGMAYRVGAELMDMEFTDFYAYVCLWPPVLAGDCWPATVRYRLDAKFYNIMGFEFWDRYRKRGATRAQSILYEVRSGRGSPHGGIYLSAAHLPANLIREQESRWGPLRKKLKVAGLDLTKDAVEVGVASMASLGGCRINAKCQTNVPGLYAAGEVASGTDGAYTLAGNMVGFCLAMGSAAGREAAIEAKTREQPKIDEEQVEVLQRKALTYLEQKGSINTFDVKSKIRDIMWEYANLIGRTKERLETAIGALEKIKTEDLPQLYCSNKSRIFNLEWVECLDVENMLTASEMTIKAALTREETRGCHFRDDFPQISPDWLKNVVISKVGDEMSIEAKPVTFPYLKPETEKGGPATDV